MSDGVPQDRFDADGRVALLRVRTYAVAALLAVVGYLLVRAVAGRTLAVAAAGAVTVAVVSLTYVRASGTYAVYPDRLVAVQGGPLGRTRAMVWDDVAFATRHQSSRAARFGVASFELVHPDEPDVRARYVTEPDRFADALARHLPSPAAWLAERSQNRLALYVTVEALADRERTGARHDATSHSGDGAGLVVPEAELADVLGVSRRQLVADELGSITGIGTTADLDAGQFSGVHERLLSGGLGLAGSGSFDADRTGTFDGPDSASLAGSPSDEDGDHAAGSLGDGAGGAEGGGE